MFEIKLIGVDGSNLLGYLAALGTLRVLSSGKDHLEARMGWNLNGAWTPTILHCTIRTAEGLLDALEKKVCGEDSISAAWKIGDDLTLTGKEFRQYLLKDLSECSWEKRMTVDFLTAFGSEAIRSGTKKEQMSDTEFRTMSGAGHQHFLGFMRELAEATSREHLQRTLFEKWDYSDVRPSLRWDPADYRPHALRAQDPSGDPIKTMRGANRLAVEALPLFPTVPDGQTLRTVGFENRKRATEVSWPIWRGSLEARTVASVLAMDELQCAEIGVAARKRFDRRGLAQVFRAKRFTEGKYRNFSPSRSLL
jgi:hypothetical protein